MWGESRDVVDGTWLSNLITIVAYLFEDSFQAYFSRCLQLYCLTHLVSGCFDHWQALVK